MQRKLLTALLAWLEDPRRKPLVLRGARQVGKTWIVRFLAEYANKQLVELNFERQPDLKALFTSNDPAEIILNIEASRNVTIKPIESLLFLDEIQAAPELLAKLRWFAEEYPELPVIAAGSLLEFVLAEHSFSMPVGRVMYHYLEPMSFEEFLQAKGLDQLLAYIEDYEWTRIIPEPIHQQLLRYFKEYLIIGGLPAAVSDWLERGSIEAVSQIHNDLLSTYRDDFAKYAGRLSTEILDEVLMSVPRMLGEKFVYSRVNKARQTESIKKALNLLAQARLCHIVKASHANGLPLGAEMNDKSQKVISLDVGLTSAMLGLTLQSTLQLDDLTLINQGGVSEQVVGQLLRTIEPSYIDPALYYWNRSEKSSNAEIDYLFANEGKVIPIEVKSGSTGSMKSLHTFMQQKGLSLAVRINSDNPSLTKVDVKTSEGKPVAYQLLSLPFYLLGQLRRLVG
ncbi:MAG: AAA family ATPase [Legionellales bacterium]|nr:AAA family ATPase [Legionellales bacterium]|tara:strand:+ start:12040 stop:13398 length:1359 start_codon:yes stop_codon:yes gene_type:complete